MKIKAYGSVQVDEVKMDGRSLAQQELRETRADFVDQPLSYRNEIVPWIGRVRQIGEFCDFLEVRSIAFEGIFMHTKAVLA
jgi:hypothetical protein